MTRENANSGPHWTEGGETLPSRAGLWPLPPGLDPADLLCPRGWPEGRNVALGPPAYWHELGVKGLFGMQGI